MNILHLEASCGWGGQEIRILEEAKGMTKRGHRVFFAVMIGGKLVEKARSAGFTVYELNFRKSGWIFCFLKLLQIFSKHHIEIVNTHSSLDSWIGGVAARFFGKKIIRTRHLSTPIKKGINSRFLYGALADFVVTTCEAILPLICSQSKKKSDVCQSIATGVDPEKIVVHPFEKKKFRKFWKLGEDDFLVGTACMMRSWKGIDELLKAANLLRDIPKLKWMIIGGGHAERHIQLCRTLKLDHLVFFTGHLEHPYPAIGSLDLFTLLSTANEGVSQAILQAAYLKKPLISTKTGGLQEVCIHEKTGLNVLPFAERDVAKAVLKMKNNPALRCSFGENAKALVLEKFTLRQTLDQMERVYQKVLRNAG